MVTIYPSAIFLIPLVFGIFIKQKWILLAFVVTTPLFSLTVFEAISRPFNFPEITILLMGVGLIGHLARRESIVTIEKKTLIIASTFLLLGISSAVALFFFPTDQTTFAYNSQYIFLDKRTSPLVYSRNNLTQTILRLFSFGSIFIIYLSFSEINLVKYIRLLVYEGVIVGVIGILFQLTVLFEVLPIEILRWFGFLSVKSLPPFLGPLPQLRSVPGEPGYTALYFLFLLGITTPIMMSNYDHLFSKTESIVFTILFTLFIFLTGSGTGFGGIIIFGVITGFYYVFLELSLPSITKIIKTGLAIVTPSVTFAILLINDLREMIYDILLELTFQGGSGNIRAYWIKFALDLFQTRPLVGYGFGSYYGLSVFGTILVSTGIIGLCLFLGFHGLIVRDLIRKHHSNTVLVGDATLSHVLAISLATMFGTMFLAKSITATLFPWYWIAVGFSLVVITDSGSRTSGS